MYSQLLETRELLFVHNNNLIHDSHSQYSKSSYLPGFLTARFLYIKQLILLSVLLVLYFR